MTNHSSPPKVQDFYPLQAVTQLSKVLLPLMEDEYPQFDKLRTELIKTLTECIYAISDGWYEFENYLKYDQFDLALNRLLRVEALVSIIMELEIGEPAQLSEIDKAILDTRIKLKGQIKRYVPKKDHSDGPEAGID